MNGVTFPDRYPHPALYEAKFLSQPVGIELLRGDQPSRPGRPGANTEATDTSNASPESGALPLSSPSSLSLPPPPPPPPLRVLFTNRYGFLSLDHLSTSWRLRSSASAGGADASLAGGSLTTALSGLRPGESRELSVEVSPAGAVGDRRRGVAVGDNRPELFLHVEQRLAAESAWAPEGHLVAWGCFPVPNVTVAAAGDPPPGRALVLQPAPPPASAPRGAPPEAAALGEGPGDAVAGPGAGAGAAVPQASAGFIAYEDADDSAPSSREVSPLVQL